MAGVPLRLGITQDRFDFAEHAWFADDAPSGYYPLLLTAGGLQAWLEGQRCRALEGLVELIFRLANVRAARVDQPETLPCQVEAAACGGFPLTEFQFLQDKFDRTLVMNS